MKYYIIIIGILLFYSCGNETSLKLIKSENGKIIGMYEARVDIKPARYDVYVPFQSLWLNSKKKLNEDLCNYLANYVQKDCEVKDGRVFIYEMEKVKKLNGVMNKAPFSDSNLRVTWREGKITKHYLKEKKKEIPDHNNDTIYLTKPGLKNKSTLVFVNDIYVDVMEYDKQYPNLYIYIDDKSYSVYKSITLKNRDTVTLILPNLYYKIDYHCSISNIEWWSDSEELQLNNDKRKISVRLTNGYKDRRLYRQVKSEE